MTLTLPQKLPIQGMHAGFRRFTIPEYHRLIDIGVLTEDDNLELIEGYLVHKMARNPPHDFALSQLYEWFFESMPRQRYLRVQMAITLSTSEPEPDLAVVRGEKSQFRHRHPTGADLELVVEISDSSLDSDQIDKAKIYALASIPIYWIVNLVDQRIEVYTLPSGPTSKPSYTQRQDFVSGQSVPVFLDGVEVAQLPVSQILS